MTSYGPYGGWLSTSSGTTTNTTLGYGNLITNSPVTVVRYDWPVTATLTAPEAPLEWLDRVVGEVCEWADAA